MTVIPIGRLVHPFLLILIVTTCFFLPPAMAADDTGIEKTRCENDEGCALDEICRDEGFCVRLECEADIDCQFTDFYCREDNICSPVNCIWDSDCLRNEMCVISKCIGNPATYVEGGVSNCQGIYLNNRWEQLGVLLIAVLLLGWLRLRRRT